jgi:hypothetical protein
MMKQKWIDPPGGWKYGFPKVLEEGKSYKELLIESGYPEEDMELALKYSRQWIDDLDDE